MTTFSTSVLRAALTPYATFWSGGQKLARNKFGSMAGMNVSQNTAYTAQTAEIWFAPTGGSPTLVYTTSGAINPPVVECSPNGEFFAIWCDWVLNKIYMAVWDNINVNTTPVVTVTPYAGYGQLSGKWSAVWSETRRRLLMMNNGSSRLDVFDENGVWLTTRKVFAATATGQLEYPFVTMTPQGWVVIVGSLSDLTTSTANYRGIVAAWSPDLVSFAAPWVAPYDDWSKVTPSPWATLPQPVDTGAFLMSRSEELNWSCLLSSVHADADQLRVVQSTLPIKAGSFLAQAGEDASHSYVSWDAKTGKPTYRAPLGAGGFQPWMPGSFMTRRGDTMYHLVLDGTDLVVTSFKEGDKVWKLGARYTLPGNGPHFAHYLTCWRGDESDDCIEGLATIVNCSMDDWVNTVGYPQSSTVVQFKLTL